MIGPRRRRGPDETIITSEGRFTAEVAPPGPARSSSSSTAYREQVPALAAAGYRAAAYDGRGYSPGVRPDPSASLEPYAVDRLVADVLDVAAATRGGAGPGALPPRRS